MNSLFKNPRRAHDAGIAIGAIIFLIAIIAVVAAVISVSSGGFNASTNTESDKSIAESIVLQSDQVEMAIQMVRMDHSCDVTQINFYNGSDGIAANPNAPADHSCDLYQPAGGGITQRAFPKALPSNSTYTGTVSDVPVPGSYNAFINVGTGANDLYLTVFNVSQSICTQINRIVNFNPPNYTPPTIAGFWINAAFNGTFPAGGTPNFGNGFIQGCYYDAQYGGGYHYIRILVVQ